MLASRCGFSLSGELELGLSAQRRLPGPLLGLEPLYLRLNGREKLLSFREVRIDYRLLGGTLTDDVKLLHTCPGQLGGSRCDLRAVVLQLVRDAAVLRRNPVGRIQHVHDFRQALRTQQHFDRGCRLSVDVDLAQPRTDPSLRDPHTALCPRQVALRSLQLCRDLFELVVSAVPALGCVSRLGIELLDL